MPGNVAVRFSVEDQEVVRKALDDLGSQGQATLKKMDDASKAPSAGMKTLSNVVDEIKGRMVGLAVPLGPIGSALIGMGPAGLVAAAGIGGVISALGKMSEMANDLATKSSRISNFAEQTGLSTDQVQALNLATVKYGKTSEETNAVIEKTAQAWDQLRKGQGTAFDEIRKIDPALLSQLASAKDLAAALDILAKAYDKTGDEAGKIALARAFGGKGGASTLGAVFTGITDSGGFGPLTADATKAGDVLNKQLVERLTTVQAQLKELREHNTDTFASLFAEHQMGAAKEAQELIKSIVDGLKWIKENANDAAILKSLAGFANGSNPFGAVQTPGAGRGTRSGREGDLDGALAPEPTRLTVGAVPAPVPLDVQLRNYRDYVAALGAAVTPTEQLKLKTLELDVAQKNNVFSTVQGSNAARDRARAEEAAKDAIKQASEAVRERLGIATQDDIVQSRMAQLAKARKDEIIKSDAELAQAEHLVQREARQTAEAMEVRNSSFKGLKQLEIDGRDLSKSLDTGLTGSLNGVENALTDVASGTVNTSDGFKNLETAAIRSLDQMLIKMTVTASLAKVLGATFNAFGIGGGPGGGITVPGFNPIKGVSGSAEGNIFTGGNITRFADGGIVSRLSHFMSPNGAMNSVAENDPEAIMPLTRINGKLGVAAAGGGGSPAPVVNVSVINNTGVAAQVSQSQGPNGDISVMLDKMVDGAVGKSLSSGSGRRVLSSQFGVKPFTGQ